MPERNRKPADEGDSNGWMVTFSDCMTLLLCFFVMLLSFSSFDPRDLTQVLAGFEMAARSSPFTNDRPPREALIPPVERVVDRTSVGAEMPTTDRLAPNQTPRAPEDPLSADAYCDRRVLTIPSGLLFWGRGASLKPQAAQLLGPVARFLRAMPCRVIIRETPGPGLSARQRLGRALAVMKHLTETEGLPAERFAVSAAGPDAAGAEPVVRLAMLNRKVYP